VNQAELPTRLAYLVSEYPAISHTFILREVRRLRAMRFEICTASINSTRRPLDQLTAEEREETAATFYIKQAGIIGAFGAHVRALIERPRAYLRGLWFAIGLGGSDLRQLIYAIFYFTEAVMLGVWMERNRMRHLHVHFGNPAATVGLIASRTFGINFSLTVHGPDEFYDVEGQHLSEKIAGAAFVICIGNYARSQLMKLSPSSTWHKFVVVPLGVDTGIFHPHATRRRGAPFQLLCVGRLVPAKGQHTLLAAVERLSRSGHALRLTFVGDGPDRATLEREVRCRGLGTIVRFVGNVNQERIGEYYGAADAFVLASYAEGIPVVLMEAMAMEIPCVATMITGIPELIRDDIDGLLVSPSDDRELARAIEKLIVDQDLCRRLGEAGRRRVLEKYDIAKNVALLARVFKARIGKGAECSGRLSSGEVD
jgi:colanic acid/amylovoran biosynthesis glycosyltransferase